MHFRMLNKHLFLILFILLVTLGCGSVSSENCSYFELNPVVQSSGPCAAQICKQNGVCQVIEILF